MPSPSTALRSASDQLSGWSRWRAGRPIQPAAPGWSDACRTGPLPAGIRGRLVSGITPYPCERGRGQLHGLRMVEIAGDWRSLYWPAGTSSAEGADGRLGHGPDCPPRRHRSRRPRGPSPNRRPGTGVWAYSEVVLVTRISSMITVRYTVDLVVVELRADDHSPITSMPRRLRAVGLGPSRRVDSRSVARETTTDTLYRLADRPGRG